VRLISHLRLLPTTLERLTVSRDLFLALAQIRPPLGHPIGMLPTPLGLELVAMLFQPGLMPGAAATTRGNAGLAVLPRPASALVEELLSAGCAVRAHQPTKGPEIRFSSWGPRFFEFLSRNTGAGVTGAWTTTADRPPTGVTASAGHHQIGNRPRRSTFADWNLVISGQWVCFAPCRTAIAAERLAFDRLSHQFAPRSVVPSRCGLASSSALLAFVFSSAAGAASVTSLARLDVAPAIQAELHQHRGSALLLLLAGVDLRPEHRLRLHRRRRVMDDVRRRLVVAAAWLPVVRFLRAHLADYFAGFGVTGKPGLV